MDVLDQINHLLNFALPAFVLAFVMPLSTRWTRMGRAATSRLTTQVLLHAVFNVLVLVAGLWVFGRDGKMLTYLGMATVCATSQWLLLAAWRA
jgi:hypothetical protein